VRRRTPFGTWAIASLSAAAVTGSLFAPVAGAHALEPATLPVADILDIDLRDGTAADHARNVTPTLFSDPEIVSVIEKGRDALAFDGDDAALYEMREQFAAMAGGFAFECSFRYDGTNLGGTEQSICGAKEAGGLATTVSNNQINFMAHIGGGYKNVRVPISAATWYHTVAVWDGAELRLYVNGELAGKTAATGEFKAPSVGARNLVLGGDAQPGENAGFFAAATVDTARVYSAAISDEEVAALYAAATEVPEAPVADILDVDFRDGTATDHAQGLPATSWGDPVVRDDAPLGRKVGEFNGSSAFLYPLADQYPALADGFAVECVFKYNDDFPASGEERGNLCGAKEAGGFSITLYGNKLSFNPNIGGYKNLQAEVQSDRWYHVVGTWDGQKAQLWVDGVMVREVDATGSLTIPPNATARNLVIGGDAATNNRAQFMAPATIASARLFSQPLDRRQVAALRSDVLAKGLSSAPVRITGSTPAADERITKATTLVVDTNAPEAVGRKVEYRIDGAAVRPGDRIGPGLTAGEHTLTMKGADVFGRPIDQSFTFRSANIPTGGGTETGQGNGTTTLSSVATNPSGGDVTTTFVEADVKVADGGFQGTVDQLPTSMEFDYAQGEELDEALRPGDDKVVTSPAATGIAFQRHDVAVTAAAGQRVVWTGAVDPTRSVTLRVWNGSTWEALDTARGQAEGSVVLEANVAERHHHGDVIPVMVTGEDPFADDIPNQIKDSFEDPADYDFSLAHLTDTQYLSEGADEPATEQERAVWRKAYTDLTQWIVDNADERKIAFTAHTGDIMENWHNLTDNREKAMREFEVASAAQKIIDDAGLVQTVLPGNHDNQYGADAGPDALYNDYFGPERYEAVAQHQRWTDAQASYHPWKPGDNINNYVLFTAGGLDFVVVSLGFDVTAEEQAWANDVLAQYADRNAIVLTHAYVTPSSNPDGRGGGMSWDGARVRDGVIKKNPNVFLVLSGHEHGVNIEVRKDLGQKGNHVVELLADYQFYKVKASELGLDGVGGHTANSLLQFGSSFFRLLQFDVDRAEMSVDTYSPFLENFGATEYDDRFRYDGTEDDFKMPIQLQTRKTSFSTDALVVLDPTDRVIGTDTARSGWPTSVSWTGLEEGETYAWQAISADSASGEELPGEITQLAMFTATKDGIADTTAPVITTPEQTIVAFGAEFDPLAGVTVADDRDGDLTDRVAVHGEVDTTEPGRQRLVYIATDAAGNQAVATREVRVEAAPSPVNTARPAVSGKAAVGAVLTATIGEWTDADAAEFKVQWLRNGAPINGATGGDYRVTAQDAGASIAVRVTAKVPGREAVAVTSSTQAVAKVKPVAKLKAKKKVKVGKRASVVATFSVTGHQPTGTAVVKVGNRTVQVVRVGTNGKVKVKLPKLKAGKHRIRVTLMAGDAHTKATAKGKIRVVR